MIISMKSPEIPMTIEEFELAEFPFGWKDEYCDGKAHLTPRSYGILMKMPVKNKKINNTVEISLLTETTVENLIELFFAAFYDSVEFCDYSQEDVKRAAAKNIKKFFDGKRGIPQLDLCRIALSSNKNKLIGACLISKYKFGFKNEILFVHPNHQRSGIGTALVSIVLNELMKISEKLFWSEYHICNEQSRNWHEKLGFAEVPDIMTLRLRRNYLKNQIWRNEQLGDFDKIEKLKPLLMKSEKILKILEKIEKKDFGEAWLQWKYEF